MSTFADGRPPVERRTLPALIGVIHLRPLPGSPGYAGDVAAIAAACARDAHALADADFDAVMVENYGDAPFEPGPVSPITIAALTRCALAARVAAPTLTLGINVLRNDALAALSIAVAAGASLVRINVHIGARLTDQGIIEGRAYETLRARRALGADHVHLLCDVDVKHSAPLAPRPLAEEAHDLAERGGADAVLVTGSGTGRSINLRELDEVSRAVRVPVLVASGVSEGSLASIRKAHGVVVGSALRADGKAGGPIDPEAAKRFAAAFFAMKQAQSEGGFESVPPPSYK